MKGIIGTKRKSFAGGIVTIIVLICLLSLNSILGVAAEENAIVDGDSVVEGSVNTEQGSVIEAFSTEQERAENVDSSEDSAAEFVPEPVTFTSENNEITSWDLSNKRTSDDLIKVVDKPITFDDEGNTVFLKNDEEGDTGVDEETRKLQEELERRQKEQKNIVDKLVEKFSSQKMDESDLNEQLKENKNRYTALHERLTSLYKQVKELDSEIAEAEHDIEVLDKKIDAIRDDIDEVEVDIDLKKNEIASQEDAIQQYILAMYANGQYDTMDILLSGNTLGDVMYELEVMSVLESQGQLMFAKMTELKEGLDADLEKLKQKKERLNEKKDEKRDRNKELKQQKKSKDELITITKGKEDAYKDLIKEAKEEQERINKDLEQLKDQLELFDAGDRAYEIERNFYDFSGKFGEVSDYGFTWPVDPIRGITAYFMDPSYRAALGVNHYAIDIRASMHTPIHAAQAGYIYKAVDSGFGYSYIVLLHSKEIATVYGHVNEFAVKEGDWVEQGDIIGYTGGQPGTKGAGFLTTGPHLHFEVRVNGKATDPMKYLP